MKGCQLLITLSGETALPLMRDICDIHVTFALKRPPSTFLSLAQVFFSLSTLSFCSFLFQDTQRLGLHFVLTAWAQRYRSAPAQ